MGKVEGYITNMQIPNNKKIGTFMKILVLLVSVILLPSIGCVSEFPFKQSGLISSYPSGVDLYLLEDNSTKESYLGKTPQSISLVTERRWQWKIKAVYKDSEPVLWFVHPWENINHEFDFTYEEKERHKAEEERRNAELLEKLKGAKREIFLPYGFDVLDFVAFAEGNLRIRGDIDFGAGVPEIDFRTFKDKNYVEVKINYLVAYNILRVSMYEAASMTFDEIVKKLAKKISTDFKKQNEIAGFIFNITYTNKDFSEKYDVPRYVTNEFILPKEACRQYATLDITNQDLINQSIVLVDGERISLNLQISK